MRKIPILLSICSLAFPVLSVAQYTWTFDDAHSNLQFSLTHLMVSEIEGSMEIKEATLITPNPDFSNASVYILADAASIDTDNNARDEHLRSVDFFDVVKYPSLTFTSTSFDKVNDNKYSVSGNLTFHGVTRKVTLDVIANTAIRPYDQETIVGFRVSGVIKRSDFGIASTTPEAILSDVTEIKANAIFVRSK